MGRWTQYDEDSYSLPEDVRRIGYDADSSKYTYIDRDGVLYESFPGEKYGPMSPVKPAEDRFFARNDDGGEAQTPSPWSPTSLTFQDILDPSLIAPDPLKVPSSSSAAKMRFVEAAHRVSGPKLYNVVIAAMRARNEKKNREPKRGGFYSLPKEKS